MISSGLNDERCIFKRVFGASYVTTRGGNAVVEAFRRASCAGLPHVVRKAETKLDSLRL